MTTIMVLPSKDVHAHTMEPMFASFFPGSSGCSLLDNVIDKAVDPTVSKDEYRAYLKDFLQTENEENAADELKQCFLQQSNETLANFKQMLVISASSDVLLQLRDRDK